MERPARMDTKAAVETAQAIVEGKDRSLVFQDPNLRHGFIQVPKQLFKDASLSSSALRLYGLLLSYAWQDKECFPGRDTLMQDMGCAKGTLCDALNELRDRKLISWERRGLGKTNVYTIKRLDGGYLSRQFVDRGAHG